MLYKRCDCADPSKCKHPFWYEFDLQKRRYRRSTKTANKQTAERAEQRRRIAILDGKDEKPSDSIRLSKHIEDYTAHTKTANVTAYKDAKVLERLEKSVADRLLKDVSPFHIERWKQQRAQQVEKSTVNRELNIVRGCFSKAVEWGRLAISPLRAVTAYKVDDQRIRIFSDEEIKLVMDGPDAFTALIGRTTLECLPRLSEVLNIHRTNIGPTWVEFRRKGGKVTRAAVTPELRQALLARCHASGFVFGEGEKGKPPTQQTGTLRIIRALRALGIENASHHTFRHTGVTLMMDHTNPRVIQTLAGWSNLRMLERYGHVRDSEMQKAVRLNAAHIAAL